MEKKKLTITIDPTCTEIIVIKGGQVFRAKSNDGRGACKDCALRDGKQCRWSMVCGNELAGAIFRAQKEKKTIDLADYYRRTDYTGD